jgi:hypothetical protein
MGDEWGRRIVSYLYSLGDESIEGRHGEESIMEVNMNEHSSSVNLYGISMLL